MDLKTLENIMVSRGISIRAIPLVINETLEVCHRDKYPDGVVCYDERFKRDMLKIKMVPKNAGKFIVEQKCGTGSLIRFMPDKYYDSIEELVADLKE